MARSAPPPVPQPPDDRGLMAVTWEVVTFPFTHWPAEHWPTGQLRFLQAASTQSVGDEGIPVAVHSWPAPHCTFAHGSAAHAPLTHTWPVPQAGVHAAWQKPSGPQVSPVGQPT